MKPANERCNDNSWKAPRQQGVLVVSGGGGVLSSCLQYMATFVSSCPKMYWYGSNDSIFLLKKPCWWPAAAVALCSCWPLTPPHFASNRRWTADVFFIYYWGPFTIHTVDGCDVDQIIAVICKNAPTTTFNTESKSLPLARSSPSQYHFDFVLLLQLFPIYWQWSATCANQWLNILPDHGIVKYCRT